MFYGLFTLKNRFLNDYRNQVTSNRVITYMRDCLGIQEVVMWMCLWYNR